MQIHYMVTVGDRPRLARIPSESVPDRRRLAFVWREVVGFETEEMRKILEVSANNMGVLYLSGAQPAAGTTGASRDDSRGAAVRRLWPRCG